MKERHGYRLNLPPDLLQAHVHRYSLPSMMSVWLKMNDPSNWLERKDGGEKKGTPLRLIYLLIA
jgi:hypothetical protein